MCGISTMNEKYALRGVGCSARTTLYGRNVHAQVA